MNKPKRVDPVGCGCTDCLTGYSVPLDQASNRILHKMVCGKVQNATGFSTEDFDIQIVPPWEAIDLMNKVRGV